MSATAGGQSQNYDLTVIGGGPGGYTAAIRAARLGARVALVERDELGGTCTNWGCIPTKAMQYSAEVYHENQERGAELGVMVSGLEVDFARLMAHKDKVVKQLTGGLAQLMKAHKIDVHRGHGTLVAPGKVRVKLNQGGATEFATQKTILATGSAVAKPPIEGLDLPGVIDSNGAVSLTELPASMVLIGGGIIGVEFGSIFAALGTKVTIVEMLPRLMPGMDEELARRAVPNLKRLGCEVVLGAAVKKITQSGDKQLTVAYTVNDKPATASGEKVLVATGRVPFHQDAVAEGLRLATGRREITIGKDYQTNIPNVWAIGDAVGGVLLAHKAMDEGEVAAFLAMTGRSPHRVNYGVIPSPVFALPELAGVGLPEEEARQKYKKVKTAKIPFGAIGRAVAMGQTNGFAKMICDEETGEVLGVHIMGPRATDLIAEPALAMAMEYTAEEIAATIHAHPTLPEAIHEAALAQTVGPIHVFNA
ncbi:MAG TPA: dihydrolipoyl dehydrogenase [Thermomicrobiales bacterium]|nr:dihydrolipoyl dehydrogenase [Thermomicrobiales bacterium]